MSFPCRHEIWYREKHVMSNRVQKINFVPVWNFIPAWISCSLHVTIPLASKSTLWSTLWLYELAFEGRKKEQNGQIKLIYTVKKLHLSKIALCKELFVINQNNKYLFEAAPTLCTIRISKYTKQKSNKGRPPVTKFLSFKHSLVNAFFPISIQGKQNFN